MKKVKVATPLAVARIKAGLSQEEAAKLCGVSQAAWGKWERGEGYPRDIEALAPILEKHMKITAARAFPKLARVFRK